jgi:hypothetical protein
MINLNNQTNEDLLYLIEGDEGADSGGLVEHGDLVTIPGPESEVYFQISFWHEGNENSPVVSVMNVPDNTLITIQKSASGVFSASKS